MSTSYIQYPSAGPTLTFIDSLVDNSGIISLVGDTATPGNNAYYGTNGVGALGFYSLSASYANVNLSNLDSPTAINVNLNMDSGTVIMLDMGSVAAPSINFGTSSPWGLYGVASGDGVGIVQGGIEYIRFYQDGSNTYLADGQHPTTTSVEFLYSEGGRMRLNAVTQLSINISGTTSYFFGTGNFESTLPILADTGISTTGNNPAANAIADFRGTTTQGVQFPLLTTLQKNAVASPGNGLVVFDTTLGKLCVYSTATTSWQTITSA